MLKRVGVDWEIPGNGITRHITEAVGISSDTLTFIEVDPSPISRKCQRSSIRRQPCYKGVVRDSARKVTMVGQRVFGREIRGRGQACDPRIATCINGDSVSYIQCVPTEISRVN